MKQLFIFLVLFFAFINTFSQNRNNIWYFGEYAGLDFNINPPVTLNNSGMFQEEGTATMCNNNGQLLFYSNGISVWNRNHTIMPNGNGLLGGQSSTQSALIVPLPGSNNIYYLFTVPTQSSVVPLSYSIIDMNLDGGLGDITTKNTALHFPVMEKLTATPKSNGIDYWIVTKEFGTDAFYVYSLTAAGVDPVPVISHTGLTPVILADVGGWAKISPDGTKLCIAYIRSGFSQLFDFDNNTGILANPIDLTSPVVYPYKAPYGVEFSPDNSKLYIMEYYECVLWQYDLLAGSPVAIQNSATQVVHVGAPEIGFTIERGPDDKIYINHFHRYYLSVINQPNLAGVACNYVYASIPLAPASRCSIGFPNNFTLATTPCAPTLNASNNVAICSNQTYQLPSGTIVNATGVYMDTIRSVGPCDSIITTVNLSVFPVSNVNSSAQICSGQTYQLPSGTIVNATGIYQDTIRSVGSCDSIITTVNLSVFPVNNINTDVQICTNQTYQLPSGTIVNIAGIYLDTIRSVSSCDSVITTVNLSVFPVSNINTAVQVCTNQTYQLPSGTIVSTAGIYIDTVKSVTGCDSVITNLNLSIFPVSHLNTAVQVCSDEIYHLPSGAIVNSSGIYLDTLRSVAGCDSIINTISVLINNVSSSNVVDSIYEGQSYILPSGQTVNTSGVYQAVLINSLGCDSVITTTLILRKTIAECITLKNAITPNGDGINDYWVLYRYLCFKKLEVSVYNRYGSLVYRSWDYKNDWNGKYKNKELPDGTYYYVIKLMSFDGKEHLFKDNVTILR